MNRLAVARAGYGLVQLAYASMILPPTYDAVARPVVQILGLRQVAQAALTAPTPTGAVLGLGAEVDLLHAGSMLVLAAAGPRRRRVALWEAGAATALAVAGIVEARQAPPEPVAEGRSRIVALRDHYAGTLARWTAPASLVPRVNK